MEDFYSDDSYLDSLYEDRYQDPYQTEYDAEMSRDLEEEAKYWRDQDRIADAVEAQIAADTERYEEMGGHWEQEDSHLDALYEE